MGVGAGGVGHQVGPGRPTVCGDFDLVAGDGEVDVGGGGGLAEVDLSLTAGGGAQVPQLGRDDPTQLIDLEAQRGEVGQVLQLGRDGPVRAFGTKG